MSRDRIDSLLFLKNIQDYHNRMNWLFDGPVDIIKWKDPKTRIADIGSMMETSILFGKTDQGQWETHFTEIEPEFNKALIWHYSRIVEYVFSQMNYSIPKNIIFGTIQSTTFNSHIISTPYGDKVLAFKTGTFDLISNLVYAVCSCLIAQGETPGYPGYFSYKSSVKYEEVEANNEAINDFKETITLFLNKRKVKRRHITSFKDRGLQNWYSDILKFSCMFMIAHEYAHVLSGHTEESLPKDGNGLRVRYREFSSGEKVISTYSTEWEKEYTCDRVAYEVCLNWGMLNKMPIELSYQHTEFALTVLNIIHHLDPKNFSETHPDPLDRLQYMRKYFQQTLQLSNETYAYATDFYAILVYLTELAFPEKSKKWEGLIFKNDTDS